MKIKSRFGFTHIQKKGSKKRHTVPLIVLHGGPGNTLITQIGLFGLSKQRQIILYDQLGSGKSSSLQKKYWNISTFVTQLDEVIKHLGLKSFHLLGSSWGGALALEYYKHKKGRGFKSLILCSPLISEQQWSKDAKKLIKTLSPKQQRIIAACEKIGATDSKVYLDAMSLYYKKYVYRKKKIPADVIQYEKLANYELYQHMWGPSEFRASGTLKNYNGVPTLIQVKCPLLITCGQYDESTPATNQKFARLHGSAQFAVIPKAAHLSLIENRGLFLKTIKKFLKTTEKPA